jgi:hypothetical protein
MNDQKDLIMLNPNPDCKQDCRFQDHGSMTTAMYYAPVYDKHGNNLNPDGNTTTTAISCSVCGKQWSASTRYNETTFKEVR